MMEALIAWAFTQPTVRRIVVETTTDNAASLRVIAKLGFIPAGVGREEGSVRFARSRPANG